MTDRKKIIEGIANVRNDIIDGYITETELAVNILTDALELLKEQEPKTGHWFISEYEYLDCSCCGESYYTGEESTEDAKRSLAEGNYYKFCPYCGAEMTGGEV